MFRHDILQEWPCYAKLIVKPIWNLENCWYFEVEEFPGTQLSKKLLRANKILNQEFS